MKHLCFLLGLALLSGCKTIAPPEAPVAEKPVINEHYGKVVRINHAEGYVVLECTFLPSAGEEITLFRDQERKIRSRVRVAPVASSRWVAADIVEGRPMLGDWFIGLPSDQQTKQSKRHHDAKFERN